MRTFLLILRRSVIILTAVAIVVVVAGYVVMQQPSFGKSPSGDRLARIEKSGRYKNGIFVNRTDTPMSPEGSSMWESAWRYFTARDEDNVPKEQLPHIKRNLKLPPPVDSPVITWFGHSSVLLQVGGKNILTDPQFSQRASPVTFAGPKAFDGTTAYTVDDLPPIDAVLVSHDHYDHLDYASIRALDSKTKIFFVQLGMGSHLEHWGIALEKIKEVDWWEETTLPGGLVIVATPSRHFSGRGLSFNKTSWGSYVVLMNDYHAFFSGDSGYDNHFTEIGNKYGPFDVALIETGQYDKLWPYIHMMPEQSVQAAVDLKALHYMPVHWSKFPLALHAWRDPIVRAGAEAAHRAVPVITPELGEQWIVEDAGSSEDWWSRLR